MRTRLILRRTPGGRAALMLCLLLSLALGSSGCFRPSRANIELRRQNWDLRTQLAQIQRMREADLARIRALEQERPIVATLPHERMQRLFTTHSLRIGRLTGGANLDPQTVGDDGLRVYVVPIDQTGGLLKAAGDFVIEFFDLTLSEPRIGQWDISAEEAGQYWIGTALTYSYIFTLPWQVVPQGDELTLRITFTDALTGRQYSVQQVVPITPPEPAPADGTAQQAPPAGS